MKTAKEFFGREMTESEKAFYWFVKGLDAKSRRGLRDYLDFLAEERRADAENSQGERARPLTS